MHQGKLISVNDEENTEVHHWIGLGMIYYGWLIWLVNELFMMIILLNFLIAKTGESYEKCNSDAKIILYSSRCHFVNEKAIEN